MSEWIYKAQEPNKKWNDDNNNSSSTTDDDAHSAFNAELRE